MAQPSRTTATFTPNVGPHSGVAAAFVLFQTPIAFGGGNNRGYPAAVGLLGVNGIMKVTFAVGDSTNEDPNFPGQTTGTYDALQTLDEPVYDPTATEGLIPYDANATSLSTLADGHWCFLSQLTS